MSVMANIGHSITQCPFRYTARNKHAERSCRAVTQGEPFKSVQTFPKDDFSIPLPENQKAVAERTLSTTKSRMLSGRFCVRVRRDRSSSTNSKRQRYRFLMSKGYERKRQLGIESRMLSGWILFSGKVSRPGRS